MSTPAPAATTTASIIDAEIISMIDSLEKTDYTTAENQKTVQSLLEKIPTVESCGTDATSKVQVLVVKSRLKLLIAIAGSDAADAAAKTKQQLKEVESDISKALKLRSQDKAAWLVMSEIQWRKKSYREARDAAESALRSAPNDVQALCQASRLARIVSSNEKSADKKPALIATSIQRAKQALAANPASSEAWLCLGLTLYHEAGSTVMTFAGLRKALSAVAQACRCDDKNADAFLNRGIIEHSLTQFADALVSFETASTIDPTLKPQCDPLFKRSYSMLMLLQARLRVPIANRQKQLGEEFKAGIKAAQAASLSPPEGTVLTGLQTAFFNAIETAKTGKAVAAAATAGSTDTADVNKTKACVVSVLRLISASNEAPLIYECVDQGKNLFCLAVCNLSPAAIDLQHSHRRPAITFKIPPSEVAVLNQLPTTTGTAIQKTLSKIEGGVHPLHCIFCDANSIYINAKPVAPEHIISATIAAEAL